MEVVLITCFTDQLTLRARPVLQDCSRKQYPSTCCTRSSYRGLDRVRVEANPFLFFYIKGHCSPEEFCSTRRASGSICEACAFIFVDITDRVSF
ncbi:hypothetical protein AVEN_129736-1 [Araneus ventricosus]|uniref:Uncharacterized protein n=1 Tax=Araneus ventricosus TaxID=182803 RepID=A0A4Y2JCF0_ARAVE|nr:hypothetical protein AVEN_129736-1 [Araneus ventricosus]